MHQCRECSVSEQPRSDSLPLSKPPAIKMARKEISFSVSKTLCALQCVLKCALQCVLKSNP